LLALLAILACMPAPPQTKTFQGPGVELRQTALDPVNITLELVAADGKTLWMKTGREFFVAAAFSDDGKWVATRHESKVRVYAATGELSTYEVFEHITKAEESALAQSSCGPLWFAGLSFEGRALAVLVNQGATLPLVDNRAPVPTIKLLIDVEKKRVTREPPARPGAEMAQPAKKPKR
jgi:hypothetical protein